MATIKNFFTVVITVLLMHVFSPIALAVTILPDPTTTVDGLPIVKPYDDFLSYSARLLIEWDNRFSVAWNGDDYNVSTGTGKLDVLIMTPAEGASNNPVTVNSTDFVFQDPLPSSTGSPQPTFDGIWGYYQPDDGKDKTAEGPVLVDRVLNYLQTAFGPDATVPVFTFDLNETGSSPDILLTARVRIIDPGCIDNSNAACDPANTANDTVIATWSLDDLFQPGNGTYDPGSPVLAQGQICVDGNTQDFCVDNNVGSGKMDFLLYAPTMDLSLYDGMGYWFVGDLHMGTTEEVCIINDKGKEECSLHTGALDNGGEELFLSGSFTPFNPPDTPTAIPEPASLILISLGIASLAFSKRFPS